MSRTEYTLNMLAALVLVALYFIRGNDVIWLFAAVFQLIHVKSDQILAEIKKRSEPTDAQVRK